MEGFRHEWHGACHKYSSLEERADWFEVGNPAVEEMERLYLEELMVLEDTQEGRDHIAIRLPHNSHK